jgi:hypothetical protein
MAPIMVQIETRTWNRPYPAPRHPIHVKPRMRSFERTWQCAKLVRVRAIRGTNRWLDHFEQGETDMGDSGKKDKGKKEQKKKPLHSLKEKRKIKSEKKK